MIITANLNEARKQADKLRKENKPIVILSQDDEFNRKALEIKNVGMLVINEALEIKDYMKQRNSSLNEVLAKICSGKGIDIGIRIDEIIKKKDVEKARALARLAQNIMLCKKAGCRIRFVEGKDKHGLSAVFLSLGASSNQAKQASF